jgi:hypothetical protein
MEQQLEVLLKICRRLRDTKLDWALTGSLGMALQGVDVPVHDIDLQTDEQGAYAMERCFRDDVVKPVTHTISERIRSHLGALEIDGIKVEIMGAIEKRLDDGSWGAPVQVIRHRRWIDVRGVRVPVLSLEYEVEAYRKMGRIERAEMLKSWLEQRGASGGPRKNKSVM